VFKCDFHSENAAVLKICNMLFLVKDFDVRITLDIACCDFTLFCCFEDYCLGTVRIELCCYSLDIENGANVTFYSQGASGKITLNGTLAGGGNVSLSNRNGGGVITLNGDMSGFTGTLNPGTSGTVKITGATGDDGVAIKDADAESAAAKVSFPARPADVTSVVTEEGYAAYFKRTAIEKEGADGVFVVTVSLDETAVAPDATLATIDCAELVDADAATLTLSNAKPGLYYSIVGGTSIESVTAEGERILATGTTVSPAKPVLESVGSVAFYRVKVSATPVAD